MTFHFTVRDDKQIRVIIDTDADCEADDPFAIAQALLTPKFMVKAICAEHFNEAGSMIPIRCSYCASAPSPTWPPPSSCTRKSSAG